MINWLLERNGKRVKIAAAWLISLFFVGSLAYLAGTHFDPRDPVWGPFLAAQIAPRWVNLCLLAGAYLILEWISRGQTVNAITQITPESSWQEKAVAAGFYVGIGYTVVYAIVNLGPGGSA